jgi:parallel beta-helix repeat protein
MNFNLIKMSIIILLLFAANAFGFQEPNTLLVEKPTPVTVKYIDASGNGDYTNFDSADNDYSNLLPPVKYIIKAGVYNDFVWDSSGTDGKEIVFEMAKGESATIRNTGNIHVINFQASYIIIDGWNGAKRGLIINGEGGVNDQYMLRMKQEYGAHDITIYRCVLQNPKGSTSGKCVVPEGNNIKLYNNIIEGSISVGVYVSNGNNIEVRNNIVRNNLGTGIQANPHSSNYTVDNLIISGNLIYGNGNGGIAGTRPGISLLSNLDRLYNCYVFNNFIWGNKVAGIKKETGVSNANIRILNNTVYGNIDHGLWIKSSGTLDIRNNIVYSNGDGEFNNWVPDSFGPDSSSASSNVTTNPNFESLNVSNENYLKLSSNSDVAINKGEDLSPQIVTVYCLGSVGTQSTVITDCFGNVRPAGDFDIGAHEYIGGTDVVPTTENETVPAVENLHITNSSN